MAKTLKKQPLLDFINVYIGHFDLEEDGDLAPQAVTLSTLKKAITDGKFDAEDSDIYFQIQQDVKDEAIRIAREEYNLDGDLPEGQTPITQSICTKFKKIDVV